METTILRLFRQVAEGATVTETAAGAHMTQAALSKALKRLDREVNAELLVRVGRQLRLTPAGRAFKHYADAALDQLERGTQAVAELADPDSGTIALGFLHTLGTWFVPSVVKSYSAQAPRVRFQLFQQDAMQLLDRLTDGTADLAMVSDDPGQSSIGWSRLFVEQLCLAVPPTHRLAKRRNVRLADVAEEPFILLDPRYKLRLTVDNLCQQAGFTPKVAFDGHEIDTLRAMVNVGLGVSIIPPPGAAAGHLPPPHPETYLRLTDVPGRRDIGIAWLHERSLPPQPERFRRYLLSKGWVDNDPAGLVS
ncbi:MAG TPA: LysR family transcriptional regulator [Acidimicrobiales bacterium]|nr:LysR family transcriptional regulator [Acidimicrobiales bacterium]